METAAQAGQDARALATAQARRGKDRMAAVALQGMARVVYRWAMSGVRCATYQWCGAALGRLPAFNSPNSFEDEKLWALEKAKAAAAKNLAAALMRWAGASLRTSVALWRTGWHADLLARQQAQNGADIVAVQRAAALRAMRRVAIRLAGDARRAAVWGWRAEQKAAALEEVFNEKGRRIGKVMGGLEEELHQTKLDLLNSRTETSAAAEAPPLPPPSATCLQRHASDAAPWLLLKSQPLLGLIGWCLQAQKAAENKASEASAAAAFTEMLEQEAAGCSTVLAPAMLCRELCRV